MTQTLAEKISLVNPDLLASHNPIYNIPHPGILFGDRRENDAVYLISEALGKALNGRPRIMKSDDSISIVAYHRDMKRLLPRVRVVVDAINAKSSEIDIDIGNLYGDNLDLIFKKKNE